MSPAARPAVPTSTDAVGAWPPSVAAAAGGFPTGFVAQL